MTASWPDDHAEMLCCLIAAGKSLLEAANELSAMFGRCFTRNACAGKAHRLGISSGLTYGEGGRRAKRPARRKRRKRMEQTIKPRITRPLMACEPIPYHKKLIDLERGECKWPFGNNDFTFCAHKAIKISPDGLEKPYFLPYCAWHTEVASNGIPQLKPIEIES